MGRRLLIATEVVAAVFLLLIALLTAGNVMLRDFGGPSIPDWYDGSRMLQGIALFWVIALTTYYGSHMCVDIVWEHLRERGRRVLDVLATSVTAAFLIPTAWMVWQKVASTGTQGTSDMRLPLVRRQGYRFVAEGAPGGGEGCFDLREAQLLVMILRQSMKDRSIPSARLGSLMP